MLWIASVPWEIPFCVCWIDSREVVIIIKEHHW